MNKNFKTILKNKQPIKIERKRKGYSKKVIVIERTKIKHSNKKIVKAKTNKKTVGGIVRDEEKDMKDLQDLLSKIYPEGSKHISSSTIHELELKNVDDLMNTTRESIFEYVENKLGIEDADYKIRIRDSLLYLSKKLKIELSMLKKKLNKQFSEDISNKIIVELGLRNVNDLINSTENEIKSYKDEAVTTGFSEIEIESLLLLRKELKKRQGLLKAKLKELFSGNISTIIHELKPTDVYDLSKLTSDDMYYFIKRLNHTSEIKNIIFNLPGKLMDNRLMLLNLMLRFFSSEETKMIIIELMLFEISDLAYSSIKKINKLSLTDEKKRKVLDLHFQEFKKFMLNKIFNDTTTNIEAKKIIINKIIFKLQDVYELMVASDSKIDEIELGDLTKGIRKILKNLRDSLNKTKKIKSNSSNSNSNSNSNS